MDWYNVFGGVNTAFIFVSLYGVFSQLRTIWRRKKQDKTRQSPTSMLSLNQLTVSFFAYLSFFIYGYSIEPFNHYIVWPRLIASLLVALILFEIWRDRHTANTKWSVGFAFLSLMLAFLGLLIDEKIEDQRRYISTSIIVIVTLLIAQGYAHQIKLIINSGITGAVDLKMSQFILMMDISTIAFAFSMGLATGWPLLMLAVTSGITKLIIMYLFRWVKFSTLAEERRNNVA